jgi:hypothetical protein
MIGTSVVTEVPEETINLVTAQRFYPSGDTRAANTTYGL